MQIQFIPGDDGEPAYVILRYHDYQTLVHGEDIAQKPISKPTKHRSTTIFINTLVKYLLNYLLPPS